MSELYERGLKALPYHTTVTIRGSLVETGLHQSIWRVWLNIIPFRVVVGHFKVVTMKLHRKDSKYIMGCIIHLTQTCLIILNDVKIIFVVRYGVVNATSLPTLMQLA